VEKTRSSAHRVRAYFTSLFLFLGNVDLARFIYYSDAIQSASCEGAAVATQSLPFAV